MLNKIGGLVCIILLFLIYCMPVCSEMHDVTVIWDYNDPSPDLEGFDLRVNNSTSIPIPATARSWSGLLDAEDGNNAIDMQARDLSGKVSVWSDPCIYNPNQDNGEIPIFTPSLPTNLDVTGI